MARDKYAATFAPVEDAPVEPPTPPADVVCECGEVLAHADGADLVLHVYEQGVILRPHVLRPLDLPLTWNCPRCGVQSIIPRVDITLTGRIR